MRILFVSNLFPDAANPHTGLPNARLLARLADHMDIRVIAARPRLPGVSISCEPRAVDSALRPTFVPVYYVPRVGSAVNHRLYAQSISSHVRQRLAAAPADLLMSAWLYPDGCAVGSLATSAGLPHVAIAQGTDVHRYLENPWRRRAILEMCEHSAATVTRSAALAGRLADAGVREDKLYPIANGVDLELFRPDDRAEVRARLGLERDRPCLLYVGNLLPIKNPGLLFEVVARCRKQRPDLKLLLVGDGPLRAELVAAAASSGLAGAVEFLGEQPPPRVAQYMQAADLLCLSSHDEGIPNVIREALGCGLRVVATRVGGVPEAMSEPFLGELVPPADRDAFAATVERLLARAPETDRIREHAERRFAWTQCVAAYCDLLRQVLTRSRSARHG